MIRASPDLLYLARRNLAGAAFHIRIILYHKLFRIHQGLLQIRNQLLHILISAVRRFLTALQYDPFHAGRDLRHKFLGRGQLLLNMLDGDGHRGLAVKGNPSRKHFKYGDAQGIDIAFLIAVAAPGLFRRSVMDGPHHIGSDRIAGGRLGNAEIRHLDLSVL